MIDGCANGAVLFCCCERSNIECRQRFSVHVSTRASVPYPPLTYCSTRVLNEAILNSIIIIVSLSVVECYKLRKEIPVQYKVRTPSSGNISLCCTFFEQGRKILDYFLQHKKRSNFTCLAWFFLPIKSNNQNNSLLLLGNPFGTLPTNLPRSILRTQKT